MCCVGVMRFAAWSFRVCACWPFWCADFRVRTFRAFGAFETQPKLIFQPSTYTALETRKSLVYHRSGHYLETFARSQVAAGLVGWLAAGSLAGCWLVAF